MLKRATSKVTFGKMPAEQTGPWSRWQPGAKGSPGVGALAGELTPQS